MKSTKIFFQNKKILIYGLGLSGNSCLKYLYKKNYIKVFDDNYSLKNNFNKNLFIKKNEILALCAIGGGLTWGSCILKL